MNKTEFKQKVREALAYQAVCASYAMQEQDEFTAEEREIFNREYERLCRFLDTDVYRS